MSARRKDPCVDVNPALPLASVVTPASCWSSLKKKPAGAATPLSEVDCGSKPPLENAHGPGVGVGIGVGVGVGATVGVGDGVGPGVGVGDGVGPGVGVGVGVAVGVGVGVGVRVGVGDGVGVGVGVGPPAEIVKLAADMPEGDT